MKKYELTDNYIKLNGHILYQIRALIDFADVGKVTLEAILNLKKI